ncbi:MAG: nuclear transport factor 2 family protein [Bacteroidota bacterium]
MKIKFTDSIQVEESFYQAFLKRDIDLMKNVWHQSDDVICIHPGSPRIYSYEEIISSWKQIFSGKEDASILIDEQIYTTVEKLSVHYIRENLSIGEKFVGSVFATNIFRDTDEGWKMIAHHASPTFISPEMITNSTLH